MSELLRNIDKRSHRADGGDISAGRLKEIADNPYGDEEKCWMAKRMLALLDEVEVATDACNGWQIKFAEADERLEAAEKRNTELNEALKQTVSGYKSCLRTGHERILELGGDCDTPEVMIAGNPDIQHAEKLIAAAADKGE